MSKSQQLDVHGLSVRGTEHEKNHDHFAIATLAKSMRLHQSNLSIDDDSRVHGHGQGHLFLVADGISDAPAPARASGTAVDSVVQYFLNELPWYHFADGEPADVTLALKDALRNAQDELLIGVPEGKDGLGSTMTLALVFWPNLYIAHVGDSRCYLSRKSELLQLTTDHTLSGTSQAIPEGPAPRGERIVWNALGGRSEEVHPEVRHLELQPGDVLAIVSSGVTGEDSEQALEAGLDQQASAEDLCGRIVGGLGSDDRTAIVVRFLPLERTHAATTSPSAPPTLDAACKTPERTAGSTAGEQARPPRGDSTAAVA